MADEALSAMSTPETISDLPSPSTASSDDDPLSPHDLSDAEREWREGLQQLELLLTMVLVPYIGKYFGRKAAYWGECRLTSSEVAMALTHATKGWAKFMTWQYPVDIQITDPTAFKAAGAIEAAATL